MKLRDLWTLAKDTVKDFGEDKATRLAAALAYYTVFSIAPLLVIIVGVAGIVLSRAEVQSQVMAQVSDAVSPQAAELLGTMLQNSFSPGGGVIATVIGLVTLLLGATGLFGQLQDALNTVWEVEPKRQGIMGTIKTRFTSFLMILGVGLLILVSLVVSTVISGLGATVGSAMPALPVVQILNFVVSLVVLTVAFAAVYKVLPDVEITWKDVWVGAAVTALLFSLGRILLSLYLARSSADSAYGAAGSLVVLLLWVYYSAQILLFGAEFTQVYARRFGTRIQPAADAVRVTDEARAQQGLGPSRSGREGQAVAQETPSPLTTQAAGRAVAASGTRPPTVLNAARNGGFPRFALRLSAAALAGVVLGVVSGLTGSRGQPE